MRTGILLAAHGSRRHPEANRLAEVLAAKLRDACLADEVIAGFQQGEPGFGEAFARLEAERVLVLPLFTAEGYYTDVALPAALAPFQASGVEVIHGAPLGASPRLVDLVTRRVQAELTEQGVPATRASVLVVGHGTRRNPESRDTTLRLAGTLGEWGLAREVQAAFLDDDPEVEIALAALTGDVIFVVPFFVGGAHATQDLPERLGSPVPGRRIVLDIPVGQYPELASLLIQQARVELARSAGSVALVGAGPGDPGLITVRGLALLRSADVVLHDRLIAPELLREVRPDAELVDVGKHPGGGWRQEEINALLVRRARRGAAVVRLKGGDPFVFGRGSEELDACTAAGVPCTVVPGISSALAAPAAAGIPLTARGEARSFAVVTAQTEGDSTGGGFARHAAALAGVDTVVVLMGHATLAEWTSQLIAAGRDPETPAACVEQGTTPAQRVISATLGTIAEEAAQEGLGSPMVVVVGVVAARAAVPAPVAAC
jgi:uroporphyrin-III C-methyltransferase